MEANQREFAKLEYERLTADAIDRLKYQVEFAHAAIRGLTLGNGGAIVALFTFIGNTATRPMNVASLWCAFGIFALGLTLTLAANFGAFFAQAFYMGSSQHEA